MIYIKLNCFLVKGVKYYDSFSNVSCFNSGKNVRRSLDTTRFFNQKCVNASNMIMFGSISNLFIKISILEIHKLEAPSTRRAHSISGNQEQPEP